MAFLHLFIINKSGGLIYNRELSSIAPLIDVNILLSIGSTFHSLCSIAVEACPVKKNSSTNGSNTSSGGVGGGSGGNNSGGSASLSASMVANSAHNIGNNNSSTNGAGNSIIGGVGGDMDDGIEIIEGEGIILCCYQTMTGVKFVIT